MGCLGFYSVVSAVSVANLVSAGRERHELWESEHHLDFKARYDAKHHHEEENSSAFAGTSEDHLVSAPLSTSTGAHRLDFKARYEAKHHEGEHQDEHSIESASIDWFTSGIQNAKTESKSNHHAMQNLEDEQSSAPTVASENYLDSEPSSISEHHLTFKARYEAKHHQEDLHSSDSAEHNLDSKVSSTSQSQGSFKERYHAKHHLEEGQSNDSTDTSGQHVDSKASKASENRVSFKERYWAEHHRGEEQANDSADSLEHHLSYKEMYEMYEAKRHNKEEHSDGSTSTSAHHLGAEMSHNARQIDGHAVLQQGRSEDSYDSFVNLVSMRAFLHSLPAHEIHHVCVTGNRAHELIQNHIMLQHHNFSEFRMESKLSPETECIVQDYAVARTRFLVAESIEDRCAGRWKVHSASCNVLVHAHEGADCTQLWKLRIINDHCVAPLVVLHSDADLLHCYDTKIAKARHRHLMPLPESCTDLTNTVRLNEGGETTSWASTIFGVGVAGAQNVIPSLMSAMQQSSHVVKRRYGHIAEDIARQDSVSLEWLRDVTLNDLRVTHESDLDFEIEMLRDDMGFPARRGFMPNLNMGFKSSQDPSSLDGSQEAAIEVSADANTKTRCGTAILDPGSGYMKAGCDTGAPTVEMPLAVAVEVYPRIMNDGFTGKLPAKSEYLMGDQEKKKRGALHMSYVMKHGMIRDVDNWKNLLKLTYKELGGSAGKTICTEPPLSPKSNTILLVQTIADASGGDVFIAKEALMTLRAANKKSGIVLDIGDGVTQVVPVFENYIMAHAINRVDFGGRDLSEYLRRLLIQVPENKGRMFGNMANMEIIEDIKKTKGKVPATAATYEDCGDYDLPDGTKIQLGEAPSRIGEALFNPVEVGVDTRGVSLMLIEALEACEIGARATMQKDVLLSGGTSEMPNLDARIKADMDLAKIETGTIGKEPDGPYKGAASLSSAAIIGDKFIGGGGDISNFAVDNYPEPTSDTETGKSEGHRPRERRRRRS